MVDLDILIPYWGKLVNIINFIGENSIWPIIIMYLIDICFGCDDLQR